MIRSKHVRFPALLVAVLLVAASAWAQESEHRPTRAERHLVELEAKVSYNEALHSYHDLALIHQIVEGSAETVLERIYWLMDHSSCATGRLPDSVADARPGNCRWSRHLRLDGREPTGWDVAIDGQWRWTRGRWLAHVPRVRDFVYGRDDYRPCEETPETWDGVRYGRACIERGEDCPSIVTQPRRRELRILDCAVPYTTRADEEGLHNFAVTSVLTPPLPPDPPSPSAS
jgi:hypothetical protein